MTSGAGTLEKKSPTSSPASGTLREEALSDLLSTRPLASEKPAQSSACCVL